MGDNISAFDSYQYDTEIRKTIPYYDEFYKQVLSVVKAASNHPLEWLDVGCGTGRMAVEAFQNAEVKRFVFCDISQNMISLVKERFDGSNSEFRNLSVLELDEKDCFDIVTAIQVLHYLSYKDHRAAIRNCLNALRKDGIFIYFENFRPKNAACLPLFLQRWKTYQLSRGKSQEEAEKQIERYGKDYFPLAVDEHINLLADCGFRYSEIIWLSNMQIGVMGIK